jgi:hypothetical protein
MNIWFLSRYYKYFTLSDYKNVANVGPDANFTGETRDTAWSWGFNRDPVAKSLDGRTGSTSRARRG